MTLSQLPHGEAYAVPAVTAEEAMAGLLTEPNVGGTTYQVTVWHEAEKTRIAQVDWVVRADPVVILRKGTSRYGYALYAKVSMLDGGAAVLVKHQCVSQQGDIPRSDLDARSLGRDHQRL